MILHCAIIFSHIESLLAVVTGCTDGIGRAYVLELARKRGMRKFYLIGRNQAKLDCIAGELSNTCSVIS